MKYSHKVLFALVVIVLVFVVFAVKSSRAPAAPLESNNAPSVTATPAMGSSTLGKSDLEALQQAIQDEYKAEAMYTAVIARFGNVKPFTNIVNAEDRHSRAIARVLESHHEPVPTPIPSNPKAPESVVAACVAGVSTEKANVALYRTLLQTVENADVHRVFTANSNASEFRHLPAFEQCAH